MTTTIVICLVAIATVVYSDSSSQRKPGKLSELRLPDATTKKIALKIKAEVEMELQQELREFKVVGYKTHTTQFSSGMNYFMKVRSGSQHFHVRAHQSVGGHLSMTKVHVGHTASDDIQFF